MLRIAVNRNYPPSGEIERAGKRSGEGRASPHAVAIRFEYDAAHLAQAVVACSIAVRLTRRAEALENHGVRIAGSLAAILGGMHGPGNERQQRPAATDRGR